MAPLPPAWFPGSAYSGLDLRTVKAFIRDHVPFARRMAHLVRTAPLRLKGPERVFTEIYARNSWRGADSLSGPGSDREQTAALRRELPGLLGELRCRSVLDAPCGDFRWMSETALAGVTYIGVDVVPALVESNRERYQTPSRTFFHLDITSDHLPHADLILCRDCLVHFSYRDVWAALRGFRASGATYLLTTTFLRHTANRDIVTGEWRPLNLELAPFEFPPPLRLIDERYTLELGLFADKSLGLWRLADLDAAIG